MKGPGLQRLWDGLTPEEQDLAEAGFLELEAEYLTLQELRQSLNLSQNDVAKALDIRQVNVSKFEHRSDPRISTLQDFIAALGGELEMLVRFADRPPVILKGFGENKHPA
jgi:hypothetical protein